jgi:hypothetical protein
MSGSVIEHAEDGFALNESNSFHRGTFLGIEYNLVQEGGFRGKR